MDITWKTYLFYIYSVPDDSIFSYITHFRVSPDGSAAQASTGTNCAADYIEVYIHHIALIFKGQE